MTAFFTRAERDELLARRLIAAPVASLELGELDGAVLYGAGVYTRTLLPCLARAGIRPAWIADANPALHGTLLEGVPVRAPHSLGEAGGRMVVMMTHHFRAMAAICREHALTRWAWFTAIRDVFSNYRYVCDPESIPWDTEIDRFADLLRGDEESLEILRRAIRWRVTALEEDLPDFTPDQYFVPEVPDAAYERFVDCGAFTGDTLLEWAGMRASRLEPERVAYHAFEPDPRNYEGLEATAAGLPRELADRVRLHAAAVGDAPGTIALVTGGLTSCVAADAEGGCRVPVVRLDDALREERVTAIKMDLEGFEPQALEGARGLILRDRPCLLVAIYHQIDHLWRIPLWIHDIGPGYRIFLRHHSKTFSETVCYAVPEEGGRT